MAYIESPFIAAIKRVRSGDCTEARLSQYLWLLRCTSNDRHSFFTPTPSWSYRIIENP